MIKKFLTSVIVEEEKSDEPIPLESIVGWMTLISLKLTRNFS